MNIDKIIELSRSVEIETESVPEEGYTPYGIWKVLVETCERVGISTTKITSQMMYNYDRNGKIVMGQKGQKRYSEDEVMNFVAKFVAKKIQSQI